MPFPYVFPFVFPGGSSAPTSVLTPDRSLGTTKRRRGLLEAMLDAGAGLLNDMYGRAVTRISYPLSATETSVMGVESTLGFGELTDGMQNARLLVGGEIIEATGRSMTAPYGFGGLTRGVDGTLPKVHPAGSIVIDLSENTSAFHRLRRGFFVNTAAEEDLDVIARNLGLHKCFGLATEQWRRLVQTLPYLPKQPSTAFEYALEALFGNTTSFRVTERPWSDPWKVFIELLLPPAVGADAIEGRFILTGGEPQVSTGLLTVDTTYQVGKVTGVYLATQAALFGERFGMTNFFDPPGSFVGNTITLSSSPGAPGTPLLIDYTVDATFNYHYLAADETVIADIDDRRPYFGDPYGPLAACLANEVRSAGILPVISSTVV